MLTSQSKKANMKNNLKVGSSKIQRSDKAICARLTPSRIIGGVLSLTILLFSLYSAIAVVNSMHAVAATATTDVKHAQIPNDKPTPTPSRTSTSTHTPTPTPSRTSTPKPTPTKKITPSPTSTSTSIPSAKSTTSPPPAASTKPTATLGTASTVTAVATQNPSQDQTSTGSSTSNGIKSTSQDRQNTEFPIIALAIGLPSSTAAILFLLVVWRFLRKRLLPTRKVKLPPSGAKPWSRVRTSDSPQNMSANGNFQANGSKDGEFYSQAPAGLDFDGITATGALAPNSSRFTPPNGMSPSPTSNFAPNNGSFVTPNSNLAPRTSIFSPASINSVTPTGIPFNASSTHPNSGSLDLNDPHLKELIKQYSEKSRAAQLQKNVDRQR
jgi:hypothetical protein